MSHRTAQTIFLGIVAAVALFAALRAGQNIFAPMLTGLVLGVVCAPLADATERLGIPRALGALLVLIGLILVAAGLALLVEPAVARAIRNAPVIWGEITELLATIRNALAGVEELQETVEGALDEDGGGGANDDDDGEDAVSLPGIGDALALAPSFAAAMLVFAGSFYFFLLSRTSLYRRIDRGPMPWGQAMLCKAESRVSRYFLTITLINATFGLLIWLVMTLVGLPQPMIWGLAAFLFNFVLYLGPACLALAFLIGGIVSFDGVMSVVPVLLYAGLNMTEGQFVTPALVGRQMEVNPLLVFVSLVFWLWLWGPIGGIIAIPVLVWVLYLLGQLDWDEPRQTAAAPRVSPP